MAEIIDLYSDPPRSYSSVSWILAVGMNCLLKQTTGFDQAPLIG
jgi:hypothetical protein